MTLDAALQELLSPVVQRIEDAGAEIAKQVELSRRIDTSGLPVNRAAFTITELHDILQLDKETIRQHFRAGALKGLQTGNRILIWRWSVLEFVGLATPQLTAPARSAGTKQERHSRTLQGS